MKSKSFFTRLSIVLAWAGCLAVSLQSNAQTFEAGTLLVNGKEYKFTGTELEDGTTIYQSEYLEQLEKRISEVIGGLGTNVETERAFLIAEQRLSPKYIADRYNKGNNKRNGFSTIQIATVVFKIDDAQIRKPNGKYLNEIDIASLVYSAIEAIRKEVTPLQGTNY